MNLNLGTQESFLHRFLLTLKSHYPGSSIASFIASKGGYERTSLENILVYFTQNTNVGLVASSPQLGCKKVAEVSAGCPQPPVYTPVFGSRICTTKILTVARILGEGDRYEILKLEHRFPEIKELCPSQVVLLLCSLWQPFCSCFAISTSSLPSILPLGGMTFYFVCAHSSGTSSVGTITSVTTMVSLLHCFRSLFLPVAFPPSRSSWVSNPKLGLLVRPLLTPAWGMVSKEKGVSGHVHIGWKIITHHPVLSFSMLSLAGRGAGGESQFFADRDKAGQSSFWSSLYQNKHIHYDFKRCGLLRWQWTPKY